MSRRRSAKPLWLKLVVEEIHARRIATGPIEACDKAECHRIAPAAEDDRNRCGRGLGGERCSDGPPRGVDLLPEKGSEGGLDPIAVAGIQDLQVHPQRE